MTRFLGLLFITLFLSACSSNDNWRTASREPAGIAPSPETEKEAVIEFYAADAFSWRGWFAVHTWVAVKAKNAAEYTVYEVVGWRVGNGAYRHCTNTKRPHQIAIGLAPNQRKCFPSQVKKHKH